MGRNAHGVGSTDHQGWVLGPGAGWGFSEVAVMVVVVMVMSLVVVSVIFPAASNPSLDDPAPSLIPDAF